MCVGCSSTQGLYRKGIAWKVVWSDQKQELKAAKNYSSFTILLAEKYIVSWAMSEQGWVTELPDGSLQYQERTNDKPWYDPYTETPNPEENARRSTARAYARRDRAVKAIDEYLKTQQQKKLSTQKDTPSTTTSSTPKPKPTTSTSTAPKPSFFSKLVSKKWRRLARDGFRSGLKKIVLDFVFPRQKGWSSASL